ncbi:MAG TPA: DEAD/DEAH box helicase [Thiobacillaceae bacterium]|nr:DEAD/DEAH box helicase [Thiobacillaceae bacterium]
MTVENTFASLALADPILRAIADAGYVTPTPIQVQAIPQVLAGGDLLAAAQTGTGKTAGFTLPILHLLSTRAAQVKPGRPRCLILVPTRELAAQVEESVKTYGKYLPLKSMVMFGGVNINPQFKALQGRVDLLVATPGRLLDHLGQKSVDLSAVEILVLDEADRMLDMGFIRDIRKVLAVLPKQRQNLLFSATFSDEIRALANGLLHQPKSVEVARRNTASEVVEQSMHRVPQAHKRDLLAHLIKRNDWQQVLVFTRTKHGANKLAEKLNKDGITAAAIHGNKSQSARTKALASFKDGSVRVLVATDIAARGIDIDQLPQVVNFELPNVPEDYVHRIGRTGRAGASGSALSLVDDEEMGYLRDIERLIKRAIVRVEIDPGFVPPAKHELMSDERPARPQGRGGPRQGQPREGQARPRQPREGQARQGQGPGAGRNASERRSPGKPAAGGGARPDVARPAQRSSPQTTAQPRKPRPAAALFSAKPSTRGH